ncbi:hypothetical protein A2U01_0113789, partial [Trifolium medium]|nr:hypothetical protein [Trifolium medium]
LLHKSPHLPPSYDDCRAVHAISRCFCVAVDERNVSVDDNFCDKLNEIQLRCLCFL